MLPIINGLDEAQSPPWQTDQVRLDEHKEELSYNEWVFLTVRTRFKAILHRLAENIAARVKLQGTWAYPEDAESIAVKLSKHKRDDRTLESFSGSLRSFDITLLSKSADVME